ncbi:MAG: AraC family transcriptional regulator [Deltaproteobacteria bacterium]|nr:AraC family transcriptional regulator [Deltaproteobacteria bacterium]
MKPETRTHYRAAIQRAVATIARHLDRAVDLGELARTAALAPLHFHHVFRGLVGETPLELHRRLRLERAAHELLHGDRPVTAIALDAGYDAHEAFTRAFRARFGAPPAAYRRQPPTAVAAEAAPHPTALAARSGIHYGAGTIEMAPFVAERPLVVTIEDLPPLRLAAVRHVGPYPRIALAFARLDAIAGPAGLYRHPELAMVAVYHDDPEATPAHELRADAAIAIPAGAALPAGLEELHLPGGRHACTTHAGPYAGLGDTWARLLGEWLPATDHAIAGVSFERYRNTPGDAAPEDLRTELCVPLA